jgi:hypothetical protein
MLKKSLIATAAISATLLAAATLLPTLAQSRSTAPAGITTTSAQASAGAGSPGKRGAADDSSARTSTRQTERDEGRSKAESSERDDRRGESIGTSNGLSKARHGSGGQPGWLSFGG